MLDKFDKVVLSNFTWMFIISIVVGSIIILINPAFDVFKMQDYLLCKLILIILFIVGRLYFSSCIKLGVVFLGWQSLMFTASIILFLAGYIQMWLNTNGDFWGIIFIVSMLSAFSVVAFIIRIFDSNSNYITSINKGRFKKSTFNFESSVWLQIKPSENNPVLAKLGLNSSNSEASFENTVRKSGVYSAVLLPLLGVLQFYDLSNFIFLFLTAGWLIGIGYITASNFFVDFYYCLKAGLNNNKKAEPN